MGAARTELQCTHLGLKQDGGEFVTINEPLLILYYKLKL